jgi:hypothetical protein
MKTTGVLEQHIASIFRSKTKPREKPTLSMQQADYSTLKMEVVCSSETPVDFHQTTKCFIPKTKVFAINAVRT